MGYRYQNDDSLFNIIIYIVCLIIGIVLGSLLMGAVIVFVWNYLRFITGLPLITWKTGLVISWALVIVGSYFKRR